MEVTDMFSSFSLDAVLDKIYFFGALALLGLVIGGLIMAFFILKTRKESKSNMSKIGWWREVSGTERIEPDRMDDVEEIVIPGTTLRVFYSKKRDLWLPRFTKGVSKNLYYVLITPAQQMVNFTLKSLSSDLKEAKLDYDHTDMLWAAENTREFIKRNYKDKSQKWWQAYQGVITTAAYIMIMTFSLIIIIYFLRGVVQDIGAVAGQLASTLERSCQNAATSGVIELK